MSRNPTLAETLRAVIGARLATVRVCLPGRVEKYDAAKQRADIKPLLRDVFKDEAGNAEAYSLPVIQNVPVVFPRAGTAFLSMPVKKGHFVTLYFSDRALDKWLSGGAEVTPDDDRTHHLTDAIAVPGLYPFGQALGSAHEDNVVLGFDDGMQVHVKEDEIALGSENPTNSVALAELLQPYLDAIQSALSSAAVVVGPNGTAAAATAITAAWALLPSYASGKVKSE